MASHTQVAARINDDRKNLLSAFFKSFANVKNINLKKKLEQYKSLQFVVDNVQDLKESISNKDAEIIL